jgi:guanylate kinase
MSIAANAMPLPSGPVRSSTERRGILFIISAPSGTGKTTLCKQLASNIPGLWHSISYTTRKPRPGEEHGREYFFADEATFQAMIDRHEFVEWARVYGHLYGTPRKTLTEKIDQGIDVLLEIDVQGALQVKKKFDDAVSVFILPPSMTILRQRLRFLRRNSTAATKGERRGMDLPRVCVHRQKRRSHAFTTRPGKHFSR